MAIETDEDRLIFFDADDFGVVAIITPASGEPRTVEGIYDAPAVTRGVRQDNGYSRQAEINMNSPTFRGRTSDLAGIKSGRASAEINGEMFAVHDVKHDGTGLTILELKKGA